MEIKLEEVDGILVGRIFENGERTCVYLVPCDENIHLFSKEQVAQISLEMF